MGLNDCLIVCLSAGLIASLSACLLVRLMSVFGCVCISVCVCVGLLV